MSHQIQRPGADEYAPFYQRYVASIPEGDLLSLLAGQLAEGRRLLEAIGDERASLPTAPGKWSPKDVVLHVADTERVMAYRALCVARGDATPLPGFEQDDYVRAAGAQGRPLADLLDELAAVRGATLALLRPLPPEALARRGTANGMPVSARALAWIIAGHERHHLRLLREALPEAATAAAAAAAGADR